jgi:hypothetical protein
MSFRKTALLLAMGMAAMATPLAFADDNDSNQAFAAQVKKMANKDGMVSKKDYMAMAEKRFDMMDKQKKGMLTQDDIMKIFGMNKGQ